MKRIKINLIETFGEVLATLSALPSTGTEAEEICWQGTAGSLVRENGKCDAEVKEALRCLYEAAHGRQVETQVGFIAIAPPIAGFLRDKPYYVATQYEFFLEAFARILAGGSPARKERTNGARTRRSKLLASHRGINVPENHPRGANGRGLLRSTTTRSQQPTLIRHD